MQRVFLLAAIVGGHSYCVLGVCLFPAFMQVKHHPWITEYGESDYRMASITKTEMEVNSCFAEICRTYRSLCLEEISAGRFLSDYRDSNSNPRKYVCVEFIERFPGLVQMRQSEIREERTRALCDDLFMQLDPWLYVSFDRLQNNTSSCPFTGGYNVAVQKPDGSPLCPIETPPSRLESQCEDTNSLTLRFRGSCSGSFVQMQSKQTVHCVGSWTEGDVHFTALKSPGNNTKMWCMRTPADPSEVKIFYLFKSLVCDAGKSIYPAYKHVILTLSKSVISNPCMDKFKECSNFRKICLSKYRRYCSQTCQNCTSGPFCVFTKHLRGSWLLASRSGMQAANITQSALHLSPASQLQCLSKKGNVFTETYVLFQSFQNGCSPKYYCLRTSALAPSVIKYQLIQKTKWLLSKPFQRMSKTCPNSYFEKQGQKSMQAHKMVLQTLLLSLDKLHPVHCDLPAHIGMNTLLRDEKNCEYSFYYSRLDNPKSIMLYNNNCSAEKQHKLRYDCLAVLNFDSDTTGLVVHTTYQSEEFLCWVFTKAHMVYFLPASDCSLDTEVILGGTIPYALKKFSVQVDTDWNLQNTTIRQSFELTNNSLPALVQFVTDEFHMPTPGASSNATRNSPRIYSLLLLLFGLWFGFKMNNSASPALFFLLDFHIDKL